METKTNITIYKKLAEVKAKIGKLTKDTANPFFKSKYADINQLIEMTDPVLAEHGLLSLQPIVDGHVVTQVIDVDTGDMVTSSLKLPDLADAQKIGSAITYFRRYSLKSLLNIQEEDDDANKAAGNKSNKDDGKQQPATKPNLQPGTDTWNAAVVELSKHEGLVFDFFDKVRKKYALIEANEKLMTEEADKVRASQVTEPTEAERVAALNKQSTPAAEITQEIRDKVAAATDIPTLTALYNDNTVLHSNKEFLEMFSARKKQITFPPKGNAKRATVAA